MDNENNEALHKSLTTLTIKEEPSSSNSRGILTPVEDNQQNLNIKPSESKKKQVVRNTSVQNVPEKIIFCLDTCLDPEYTPFKVADDTSYTPMFMLKRVIEFFVQNKNFIDTRHEFALLALDKANVKWLQDFTNLPREIIKPLSELNYNCEQDEEYDLSVLLDEVWRTVSVPKPEKELNKSPPYVVRLILLYSRSFCLPVLKKSFKELLENPYFIIDTIATYEEATEINKLREILTNLQIDEKGYSYNFWVGRDAKSLHEAMAKLLAHPMQRPIQSENMSYASPVYEKEE